MSFLTVNVYRDGIFIYHPFRYHAGITNVVTDIDFSGFSYKDLFEFVYKMCEDIPKNLYYKTPSHPITQLFELKNDDDMKRLRRYPFFSDKESEHSDDEFEIRKDVPEFVELDMEGEEDVKIPKRKLQDKWLNSLCDGNYIRMSRRLREEKTNTKEEGIVVEDIEIEKVHPDHRFRDGVRYPAHDPTQPWNLQKPILGMRFESPEHLKFSLINYAVAHGYQLWYYKNEPFALLVKCDRNVDEGRCASKKGNKDRIVGRKARNLKLAKEASQKEAECSKPKEAECSKPKEAEFKPKEAECSNPIVSPRRTKHMAKRKSAKTCPFRLWASWMQHEKSFQIKSLNDEHTCLRQFNLGSLVTCKWIAVHMAKRILEDRKLSYRKMKQEIKERFLIDVSHGQCKRAKLWALHDYGGGLKEHYARLWDYREELLRSNPGSTVALDVDSNGSTYFNKMYICFKALKDGWLSGCRRVIGVDSCFLKSTVTGVLISAVGRDANNQMFPIAWAVAGAENKDTWNWFLSLLHDDLNLNQGTDLTILSDGHKGLLEAVGTWLPSAEHRQCVRHLYANFKKKWNGLVYRNLFWGAAYATIQEDFHNKMEELKNLDQMAYDYLVEKNPNTWCRAFFHMDRACAAF